MGYRLACFVGSRALGGSAVATLLGVCIGAVLIVGYIAAMHALGCLIKWLVTGELAWDYDDAFPVGQLAALLIAGIIGLGSIVGHAALATWSH